MNQPEQLEKEPQTLWSCPTFTTSLTSTGRECRFAFVASGCTWHWESWCDGILLMNVCAGQVKGGAVQSLLCEQPALCLLCTICVTTRNMGRGWTVEMWS